MAQLSKGQRRVVTGFNPGENAQVDDLKRLGADLIDAIEAIPHGNNESPRWKAEAQTLIETGIMFAVKAATAGQDPDLQ